MKINKKKIGIGAVLAVVVICMIVYGMSAFSGEENEIDELLNPLVPEIESEAMQYANKLEAVDNLKEVKESNAPSIYNEDYFDKEGSFDPDFIEKEKQRLVDSVYNSGRINYSTGGYRKKEVDKAINSIVHKAPKKVNIDSIKKVEAIEAKEIEFNQQLFFAVAPSIINDTKTSIPILKVAVDGSQVLKANDRVLLRTLENVVIDGVSLPKNTPVYGIVSFAPNRVLIDILSIGNVPLSFKAYDFEDNREGIYIENTFRAEATREVVDDAVGDISIPGVPQVNGFKRIFQRSNRNVKVLAHHNYKLILKVNPR